MVIGFAILGANKQIHTLKEEMSEFAKEDGAQVVKLDESNSAPERGASGKLVNWHPFPPSTRLVTGKRLDAAFNFIPPFVTSKDDETMASSPFGMIPGGSSSASL